MGLLDSLDPFGILGGDDTPSYAKQSKGYFSKVLQPYLDSGKSESDYLFGAAQDVFGDILGTIGEGYGNARANLADQGRVATQGIMDAQTQALGASQQAATSAGLSGSTAHGTANRGIASDTSRALAGLAAQLGQLRSSLDVGQSQAEANALGGLSNLFQNQAGAAQNFTGLAFSGLNQTPITPKQEGPLGGLLQGLGQALPFLAMSGGV